MSLSPTHHVDGILPSFENDEKRATSSMRQMICNIILGKSKALVFGQFLSLMLRAYFGEKGNIHYSLGYSPLVPQIR